MHIHTTLALKSWPHARGAGTSATLKPRLLPAHLISKSHYSWAWGSYGSFEGDVDMVGIL